MVGTGVEVLGQARGHRFGRAVGHHRVDQFVAARLGDVGVGEAQPLPVVDVVAQVQIEADAVAAECAGGFGVGGQHHLVLGSQEHRAAHQIAGLGGVFRVVR